MTIAEVIRKPAQLACPLQRELFAYWDSARGSQPFPDRTEVDPSELPRALLPYLVLFKPVEARTDFEITLAGTKVVEEFDMEPTGLQLSRLPMHGREATLATCRRVAATAVPVHATLDCQVWGKPWRRVEHLLLPLARNSDHVALILGALAYHNSSAAEDITTIGGAI